ncbi:MAG: hypothetical protein M3081_15930 [Gemmatimonadota bacterium]|nr:hypothetical protein [Gemmatimonadota bacterium]
MDIRLAQRDARAVRASIARAILGDGCTPGVIGGIALRSHQLVAIDRLRVILRERHGALLADEVGLGKTYVAAALLREASHPLVIAPASLRSMWREALVAADVAAEFVSYESLSRGRSPRTVAPDLIVLDEAHHARTPSTRRYRALALLALRAHVLFLSATPIHNARRDLAALIALVAGSAAWTMDDAALSRFVLRRDGSDVGASATIPDVSPMHWLEVGDDVALLEPLLALPPPVPPRGAGHGGALLTISLLKQWASSRAALVGALRRRLERGSALCAALEGGTHPSREELASWLAGDGAVQLGFAGLLAPTSPTSGEMMSGVVAHIRAVRVLLDLARADSTIDVRRGKRILELRNAHAGEKIVAFSAYADTVSAMFGALRHVGGACALTGKGARVAGGALSRTEALARFAPIGSRAHRPRSVEKIDLLLTTDLLAEGVNLQDASVVLHLDLPWTGARLEQRVGRSRRIGAPHSLTSVYALAPPAAVEEVLRVESRIAKKLGHARAVLGGDLLLLHPATAQGDESVARRRARIVQLLSRWKNGAAREDDRALMAASLARVEGALIAVRDASGSHLLAVAADGRATDDAVAVEGLLHQARGDDAELDERRVDTAIAAALRWLARREAARRAGVDVAATSSARRRASRDVAGALDSTPFHRRAKRADLFARGLASASTMQSIGAEWRMADGVELAPGGDSAPATSEILAILLLVPGMHSRE